jgi:hypothetical protein
MERQRLSNLPFVENAFASTLFYRVGVKQVVGGTGLAMAYIALMMALALCGQLKLRQLVRSRLLNSNAMRSQVLGSSNRYEFYTSAHIKCFLT